MKIKHIVKLIFVIIISILIFGIIGFFIGVGLGANSKYTYECQYVNGVEMCGSTPSFVYRGVAGYEAGGLLGMHLGAIVGLVAGIFIWKKRYAKST